MTHSEETTRFSINVSVAFGSDTHQVATLLKQVALDHPESEPGQEPLVILKDFGDSALESPVLATTAVDKSSASKSSW